MHSNLLACFAQYDVAANLPRIEQAKLACWRAHYAVCSPTTACLWTATSSVAMRPPPFLDMSISTHAEQHGCRYGLGQSAGCFDCPRKHDRQYMSTSLVPAHMMQAASKAPFPATHGSTNGIQHYTIWRAPACPYGKRCR